MLHPLLPPGALLPLNTGMRSGGEQPRALESRGASGKEGDAGRSCQGVGPGLMGICLVQQESFDLSQMKPFSILLMEQNQ